MRALVGLLALAMGLAGCVAGSGPATTAGSCVTMAPGPDGKMQKTVIEADDPGMLAALCSGEGPALVADDAPTPARVPMSVPVAPVKAAPAPVLAPAQTRPAPVRPGPHGPACGLLMVGGTSYVCNPA